jgi:hypothetical protein
MWPFSKTNKTETAVHGEEIAKLKQSIDDLNRTMQEVVRLLSVNSQTQSINHLVSHQVTAGNDLQNDGIPMFTPSHILPEKSECSVNINAVDVCGDSLEIGKKALEMLKRQK